MVKGNVKRTGRKNKNDSQAWIVIGVMIGIILILVITTMVVRNMRTFQYEGLTFTKERFDKINVYHYYYYFSDESGQQYRYNLYLRNDPRENEVPINANITFGNKKVYVGIGDGISQCRDSARDVASLYSFLHNNLIDVKAGLTNEIEAVESNLTHVSCSRYPNNKVIVISEGDETEITQDKNCYEIKVANCELLDAVEKFEVESILHAKRNP